MLRRLLPILLLLLSLNLSAQTDKLRVEPPFWWAGMHNSSLQLMVHGTGIKSSTPWIDYAGVRIDTVVRTGNPNYLFIYLRISDMAEAGSFDIIFDQGMKKKNPRFTYELRLRDERSALRKGFGPEDVIYMLMPDRFANGDPSNDDIPGMLEKANRSNPDGRHGGDIQGIINNLDYFSRKLGVSAVWINPLLENNMPSYSYHGYAATDFFRIDPRFGKNEDYVRLSKAMKEQGLKLISDMVFNHCGLNHWWMKDLPTETWIHTFPQFTRSNYRAETLMDPYASKSDRHEMLNGWFDQGMPDLNQKDTLLARYLIQNSIWWIEYANLSGIRMDTWPYVDAGFLKHWIEDVSYEYPNFTILGETWLQKEAHTAWFQSSSGNGLNPLSNLNTLTDFPTCYAINRAFKENESWTGGISNLYYVLSQDFLYARPENIVTFVDNHDLMRYFTNQEENIDYWDLGMTFLMTTRGIPVIYYGTEILMTGDKSKGDADLRKDFPGGWAEDPVNAFTGTGLSSEEQFAIDRFRDLVKLRRQGLINHGKLIHYVPRDGVYVYGWNRENHPTLIVIMNNNKNSVEFSIDRYTELTDSGKQFYDAITGKQLSDLPIQIGAKNSLILEAR